MNKIFEVLAKDIKWPFNIIIYCALVLGTLFIINFFYDLRREGQNNFTRDRVLRVHGHLRNLRIDIILLFQDEHSLPSNIHDFEELTRKYNKPGVNVSDHYIDPFSGKKLQYILKDDTNAIIDSIGPDKIDQGGLIESVFEKGAYSKGDISLWINANEINSGTIQMKLRGKTDHFKIRKADSLENL